MTHTHTVASTACKTLCICCREFHGVKSDWMWKKDLVDVCVCIYIQCVRVHTVSITCTVCYEHPISSGGNHVLCMNHILTVCLLQRDRWTSELTGRSIHTCCLGILCFAGQLSSGKGK